MPGVACVHVMSQVRPLTWDGMSIQFGEHAAETCFIRVLAISLLVSQVIALTGDGEGAVCFQVSGPCSTERWL